MHTRNVVVLVAITVLVSLGVTQMADAAIPTNISIAHNGASTNAKSGDIVTVTFDTESGSILRGGTIDGETATSVVSGTVGTLTLTLSVPPSIPTFTKTISIVTSTPITITGLSEAGSTVKLFDDGTLVDTVTATSGTFEFTGVALDEGANDFTVTASDGIHTTEGDETLDIYLDTTPPVFTDTSTTATAKVGDVIPTLTCTDPGGGYTFVWQTIEGNFDLTESTSVTYTCTDAVGKQTVQTVVYNVAAIPPAVPTDISIASDNARDTSLAKSGDIVTITFDTEEGSTVEGTIGGGTATFTFNGTSSTLARTLDGTESSGVLAFSFVQTDATSNDAAAPQTAVKGTGSTTSVTADFAAPVVTNAGSSYANTSQGSSYTLPTMTCDDNIDADKDILPPVTFHTINAGTNVIYYQCSDAAGNESNRFAFTVNVVQVTPPTSTITTLRAENGANATQSISLELIGKYPIYYISLLNPYTAPELSCVEDTDGTLNRFDPQLLPSSTTIKHHTAGDYPQHYQCAGTQGTNNYNVIVTVHEIATINEIRSGADVLFLDTAPKPVRYYTAPIDEDFIKHVPQKSVRYSTAPLTMTFSGYLDLDSLISLYDDNTSQTHPVMTSVVYAADKANIEYTFTPTSGANPHISIRIDGLYQIDDDYLLIHDSDISGPDLSLIGDAVMSLEKDAAFTDPGASCSDPEDGTLTVSTAGSVDNTAVGLYNLSYTCTDSDGHVDTEYRSVYYITDTTAPADTKAPAIPAFTNSTATVSTTPIILAGTAEADSTVELFKGVTSVTTVTATSGTFEFAGVTLSEGSNSFTIAATDASSNISAKSDALVITLDTVPPSIPTFTKTISIVTSTPITITGLSEAGSTVELFDDETLVDTVTATSGTFEFTGVALDEDVNDFTVTASDGIHTTDGDETLDIYLDTTPPVFTDTSTTATAKVGDVIPTLTCTDPGGGYTFVWQTIEGNFDLAESTSVTYTCTDAVGKQTVQTVVYNVAATPPAVPTDISIASDNADTSLAKSGDIVTITFDTDAGSTVEGTIGGGTATFTFNGTSSTLARTLDGAESPGVLAFSFVQTDATSNDAAAPQTAVKGTGSTTSVTADFAAPAIPAFTNSTATVSTTPITLAGTAESDSTVTLYKGESVVATVTATSGTFEFAGVALAEGSNGFTLTATDAALNTSAKSGALVITLDTTAPAAPIFTTLPATVSTTPITLAGTAESDSTVTLYKGESVVATVTATSGTFEFAGVALAEGSNGFTLTATDAALNTSAKSGALVITLDTTAPAAPIFTTLPATVSTTPITLAGTAESDSTVTLYKGESVVATVTATSGTFEFAGVALAKGSNGFTLTATDAALNTSAKSGALVITLDTTAPAAPIFTTLPATVSTTPITLAGTAESDSTVTLYKGESVVATVTATSGTFEFAGVALAKGSNGFTLTATDAALNTSAKSGALVITLDTTAPAAPIFTTLPATVSTTPITLAGTAESDSTVTLYKGESVVATVTATSGTFEFAGVALAKGSNGFTLTATDAALNTSAKSGALVITLDTTAPAIPAFTNSTATVSSSPVTLAGTAEADSVVTLYKGESVVTTVTATSGTFEFAGVALAKGSNGFTLTATDAALNTSAKSGALVITLDTTAPAIPAFINSTATVSSSPVTLAGTAEADSVVTLYKGESVVTTVTATSGTFEFAGVALAKGSNGFTLTATDAALNTSAKSGALVITLDTTAPAAPIFTTLPATVSTTPITLAGTAESDSTVTLYKGESVVATVTATSGTFEFAGVALAKGSWFYSYGN